MVRRASRDGLEDSPATAHVGGSAPPFNAQRSLAGRAEGDVLPRLRDEHRQVEEAGGDPPVPATDRAAPPIRTTRRGVTPTARNGSTASARPQSIPSMAARTRWAWVALARVSPCNRPVASGSGGVRSPSRKGSSVSPSVSSQARNQLVQLVELESGHRQRSTDHAGGVEGGDQRQEAAGGVGEAGHDSRSRRAPAARDREHGAAGAEREHDVAVGAGRGRARRPCCPRSRLRGPAPTPSPPPGRRDRPLPGRRARGRTPRWRRSSQ